MVLPWIPWICDFSKAPNMSSRSTWSKRYSRTHPMHSAKRIRNEDRRSDLLCQWDTHIIVRVLVGWPYRNRHEERLRVARTLYTALPSEDCVMYSEMGALLRNGFLTQKWVSYSEYGFFYTEDGRPLPATILVVHKTWLLLRTISWLVCYMRQRDIKRS